MNLEQRHVWNLIKTQILNVAAQLQNDKIYTKETASDDLIAIVDMMEK